MTAHYKIEIQGFDVVLKLSYKAGKFHRLERQKGKFTDLMIRHIGKIIPPKAEDFSTFSQRHKDVFYTNLSANKPKSQFSKFNEAWFSFYESFTGLPPKFGAADGMHLKKIMKHLETVGGSPEEALNLWSTMLSAWPKLSDFHKENTDLKYINSRLNVILTAIKKANDPNGATGASSDLRAKTAKGLGLV